VPRSRTAYGVSWIEEISQSILAGPTARYSSVARGTGAKKWGCECVRCPPETATRIIVPLHGALRLHCHIVEHDRNEMMRPCSILESGHISA